MIPNVTTNIFVQTMPEQIVMLNNMKIHILCCYVVYRKRSKQNVLGKFLRLWLG